jgi:uncharacterized protein
MSLTLDENHATYQIKAFKPGFIRVNNTTLTRSLIISPIKLITDWSPQSLDELQKEDLQEVLSFQPTILLIGTGTTLAFPPLEVYGNLINQGIGVEIMDTSAACRTYTALTAEERNVVAALIIR